MNLHNLRDSLEWRSLNLPMNTCSNEACKLYDVTLSQLVIWRENEQFGGIEGSIEKMLNADPNFVLGHVLKNGAQLIGSSSFQDNDQFEPITKMSQLANKLSNSLTKREIKHVEAVKHLYKGNPNLSCELWEEILIDNPNDMLAIKFSHDTYFYLGQQSQMRDSIARVLPYWKTSMPLYSYLHGMHSFGLVQTNFFSEAKQSALNALEMNQNDCWATHSICHYYEYKNDHESGIKFLRSTENDWSICNLLSPHNYWHLTLYHLERDEHEAAIEIYDQNIFKSAYLNRTLDMVDLISFLFRLKLDQCKIPLEERWSKLRDIFKTRFRDHGYTFNDAHILILLNAIQDKDAQKEFFTSFNDYLNTEEYEVDSCNNIVKSSKKSNYLKNINQTIGEKIFKAICLFNQKEYDQVVDLLKPVRYKLVEIGGSNAQRDIFSQMLVQSALLSNTEENKKFGLALINERLALKKGSNLTKRFLNRFLNHH